MEGRGGGLAHVMVGISCISHPYKHKQAVFVVFFWKLFIGEKIRWFENSVPVLRLEGNIIKGNISFWGLVG